MSTNKITIFCDGGCRGNGKESNIGAYGAILQYGDYIKEIKQAERNTTNNKQELKGAINALKLINQFNIPVEVITDSNYVVQGMTSWIYSWIKKGWRNSQKKSVENKELWIELNDLRNKFDDIKFTHCLGHVGVEGNERADTLVNEAMDELERKCK